MHFDPVLRAITRSVIRMQVLNQSQTLRYGLLNLRKWIIYHSACTRTGNCGYYHMGHESLASPTVRLLFLPGLNHYRGEYWRPTRIAVQIDP
jgi:hypothetical protein